MLFKPGDTVRIKLKFHNEKWFKKKFKPSSIFTIVSICEVELFHCDLDTLVFEKSNSGVVEMVDINDNSISEFIMGTYLELIIVEETLEFFYDKEV